MLSVFHRIVRKEKRRFAIQCFICFSLLVVFSSAALAQTKAEAVRTKVQKVEVKGSGDVTLVEEGDAAIEIQSLDFDMPQRETLPEMMGEKAPAEDKPKEDKDPIDFIKMLEEEGISPEDLRENPELRKEMMKKMRQRMQDKKTDENDPENKAEEEYANEGQEERRRRRNDNNNNQDPMKAYVETVVENNLFMPLGSGKEERKTSFALTAVISSTSEGSSKKAIIEEDGGRKSYYVSEGEKITDNLEVLNIEDEAVKLRRDGNEEEIRLGAGTSGGGPRGGGPGPSDRPEGRRGRDNRDDGSQEKDFRRDDRDDFDASRIPPFARKMLEERGISIEELQNNPELREKLRQEFETQIRNNPQMMREVSGRRNRRR